VDALASELTAHGADWQLHAFMATFANDLGRGIVYDETTARRAWASLVDLLAETFDG
jgi:dienelactone hydrolase